MLGASAGSAAGAATSNLLDALSSASADPTAGLSLTLTTTVSMSTSVNIKQFSAYRACTSGQQPTATLPCEPGATALGPNNQVLTSQVLACPPASCIPFGCPGYQFSRVGITPCAINSSAPVGTTYSVTFMLVVLPASGSVPVSMSTQRTITIVSPCSAGQYVCGTSCSQVTVLFSFRCPVT